MPENECCVLRTTNMPSENSAVTAGCIISRVLYISNVLEPNKRNDGQVIEQIIYGALEPIDTDNNILSFFPICLTYFRI